jgi:hypothetical protein
VSESEAEGRKPYEPAFLPSAGYEYKSATLHVFDRRQEVDPTTLRYSDDHGPRGTRIPIAIIYKCTETGAERVWGVE